MNILRNEGFRGVFKGLSVTGAREFLGYGFYFATYEVLTKTSAEEAPVGTPMMLFAGGMSGTVSWVLTYPIDVVKTRFQADMGRYSGVVDCLKKSVQNEGLSCLSRGLTPTIIRAFPTNAITFTVVTLVMRCADFSAHESIGVAKILDSVVETLPKKKHIITYTDDLVDKTVNFKFNWFLRMNAPRYFLTSEDLWVGGVNDEVVDQNLLNVVRDDEWNEMKLEADLLAAEQKMYDDLAQEFKKSDFYCYTKPDLNKDEYKANKR